jgi:hypothetical protein
LTTYFDFDFDFDEILKLTTKSEENTHGFVRKKDFWGLKV